MNSKSLKYILDIESVISEIEEILRKSDGSFFNFQKEIVLKRAAERDLEIIGEAVRKLQEVDASIAISSVKKIIGLR